MKFPFSRREKDEARTHRLLDALDRATEARPDPDAELSDFETVVLFGVGYDPTQPYPPAGHPYPR